MKQMVSNSRTGVFALLLKSDSLCQTLVYSDETRAVSFREHNQDLSMHVRCKQNNVECSSILLLR